MTATPNSLKAQIEAELLLVDDPRVVALVRGLLIEPVATTLDWDYGEPNEKYAGWIVLDDSVGSDAAIAYCDKGFGPKSPWGLVGSQSIEEQRSIGMDSAWFPTFMGAFLDSFAALEIERWSGSD